MLSKTTINFANRRGLDVSNTVCDDLTSTIGFVNQIWIWEMSNDSEPLCMYRSNIDGSFTWDGNIYLEQSIKEELPSHIRDECHLREVLNFISKELN